jgi:hypothetical protein
VTPWGRWFTAAEWACRCGRAACDAPTVPEPALVAMLDRLRDALGAPLVITSGLRCTVWNAREGGQPDSGHLIGTEVDVAVPTSGYRYRLLYEALTLGVKRIGIGNTFCHLGVSRTLPQDVIWTY